MALTLYEKVSLNFGSGVVAVALIGTLSYVSLGKLAAATRAAGDTEAVLEQVDMLRSSIANAGTAQLRFRSEVAAVCTLKAGTVMRVHKVS